MRYSTALAFLAWMAVTAVEAADSIPQWAIHELTFSIPNSDWTEELPPVRVDFRHASTKQTIALDGFWDGGSTWKVRFAPPQPGVWVWQVRGMEDKRGELRATVPSRPQIASNPNYQGHIRPDPTGRYFMYADGTPFFWLGDTLWAMGSLRCGIGAKRDGPFFQWLADRKRKGFTVAFAEYVELTEANEGGLPFPSAAKGDFSLSDLNPEYFRALDVRVQALHDTGFVIAAHPLWVGKHYPLQPEAVRRLSRYLLARYGAYNIVWSLSGEYQYSYGIKGARWSKADWQSLGAAVASFNVYKHPISIHPSGQQWSERARWPRESYSQSSGGEFHDEPWLDHNWTQTGHAVDRLWLVVKRTAENYARTPHKPVIHSEGFYENHWPEGAKPEHIRWQAWAAMLNGAAGHGYGAHPLWGFYDPDHIKGESKDHLKKAPWDASTWREAIAYAGSGQFRHFAEYVRSIPWWTLTPMRQSISTGRPPNEKSLTDPHLAVSASGLHVAYIPVGNGGKRIDIALRKAGSYAVRRLSPRDGSIVKLPHVANSNRWQWTVPDDQDWILELTLH